MRSTIAVVLTTCLIACLIPRPAAAGTDQDIARLVGGLGIVRGLAYALAHSGREAQMKIVGTGVTTFPSDGEQHHVRPGEALYTKYNYQAIEQATTQSRFTLSSGALVFEGAQFYKMANGEWCQPGANGKCYADEDADGDFDKPGRDPESGKKTDIPYTTHRIHIDVPSDGFRTELVYQGSGGGVLRLAYREFIDDMARPAFTQDLTYDLSPNGSTTMIAFQTLNVEVLEANNMGLRYVVHPVHEEPGQSGGEGGVTGR